MIAFQNSIAYRSITIVWLAMLMQFQGCSNSDGAQKKKNDSTETQAGNIVVLKQDASRNPFLAQVDDQPIATCSEDSSILAHFKCVMQQLQQATCPIEVGPEPEPDFSKQQDLSDILFVENCIGAVSYGNDEGTREYAYYKGKLIDKTATYYLCLFLYSDAVGFKYELISFSHEGKLIAKQELGAQCSDAYTNYGTLSSKSTFDIYNNVLDLKDGNYFVKEQTHTRYHILSSGKFERVNP